VSATTVYEYEQRAQELEQSKVPMFLRIAQWVVWAVYALVVVNVILLVMAFVLRLFGASTDAEFTQWVYRSTEFAMRPFRGIFPSHEIGEESVLDLSLLFGALMYILLAVGLDAAVDALRRKAVRREQEAARARVEADAVKRQYEMQRAAAVEAERLRAATAAQQQVDPWAATVRTQATASTPGTTPPTPSTSPSTGVPPTPDGV